MTTALPLPKLYDDTVDAVDRADRHIRLTLANSESPAVTCSMQLGGLVLLHLLVAHDPDIDVIFVDTGYHFPETIEFLDMLVDRWDLNLTVTSPPTSVAEHEAEYGKQHALDPARCCELRKVWPADEALSGHDLWFTAVRTEQAGTRRHLELTEVHQLLTGQSINKANPLRDWAWINVETYAAENDIPRHPLYERGYTSIGCAPCTVPTFGLGDDRSGRWADVQGRTECGLHVGRSHRTN